jgi:hypothetical protein
MNNKSTERERGRKIENESKPIFFFFFGLLSLLGNARPIK